MPVPTMVNAIVQSNKGKTFKSTLVPGFPTRITVFQIHKVTSRQPLVMSFLKSVTGIGGFRSTVCIKLGHATRSLGELKLQPRALWRQNYWPPARMGILTVAAGESRVFVDVSYWSTAKSTKPTPAMHSEETGWANGRAFFPVSAGVEGKVMVSRSIGGRDLRKSNQLVFLVCWHAGKIDRWH